MLSAPFSPGNLKIVVLKGSGNYFDILCEYLHRQRDTDAVRHRQRETQTQSDTDRERHRHSQTDRPTDEKEEMESERAAVDKEKKRLWNRLAPLFTIMAAHYLISYQLFVSTR